MVWDFFGEELLEWFYGKDIIIDIIVSCVLIILLLFAYKYYKINSDKRFILFIAAIGSLFLSFLFKILSHLQVYYTVIEKKQIGAILLTYKALKVSNLPVFIGLWGYRFLTILGLYLLYSLYQKKQSKGVMLLVAYLILILSYLSHDVYFIFHLTCLILITMIVYKYFETSRKERLYKRKLLGYSFIILMVSHFFFLILYLNTSYYIFGELVQLAGYLLILFTFIKVLIDGKKKKQD